MKLRFIPLALLTISALVLAGCTDGDESTGGTDPYADAGGGAGGGSVSGTLNVEGEGEENESASNETAADEPPADG